MSPFDLNWRHLRAVGIVVARGGVSPAADAVHLSQPALTKGLAKLERQLGVALFVRRSDGVEPTEAGSSLALRVSAATAHLAAAITGVMRRGVLFRLEELMTATQLRAMLAVADAGGFAPARARTGLSEPALHRAVRELEQIVGTSLVERRGRHAQITPAGRRLARGIRLAAREIAAGVAEARGDGGAFGPVMIGAMPLARARVLPLAVAAFQREIPAASTWITEGSWIELVEPLRDGRLDLMIGALRADPPADLVQRPLFRDSLVVVARSGHALAGTSPTIDSLAAYPWIAAAPGTPLLAQWRALFDPLPLPRAPVVCGSAVAIRTMLAESDMLTLLSPDQVAVEVAAGLLAVIGAPIEHGVREIGIVTRAGWRPTADQRHLLDLIERKARTALPEMP